ncbi:hypothetical protein G6F68_018786 [Rhizopus microsporus]|nr:hypothetical protein G6F68_018786 [Rhizopus microsporus]
MASSVELLPLLAEVPAPLPGRDCSRISNLVHRRRVCLVGGAAGRAAFPGGGWPLAAGSAQRRTDYAGPAPNPARCAR